MTFRWAIDLNAIASKRGILKNTERFEDSGQDVKASKSFPSIYLKTMR